MRFWRRRSGSTESTVPTDPVGYITAEYVNGNIDVEEFERRVGSYLEGEPVVPDYDPAEAARTGMWTPAPLSAGAWLGSAMDQDRESKARGIER